MVHETVMTLEVLTNGLVIRVGFRGFDCRLVGHSQAVIVLGAGRENANTRRFKATTPIIA